MERYIFVCATKATCEKCCFEEDSVARCNENIMKAKKDCAVNCLKVNGYYGIVSEEDVNKGIA